MTVSFFQVIPTGWRSVPAKHAASLNPEVLPESTPQETELSYVDIAALEGGDASASFTPKELTFATAPSRARRVIRSGDTILSTVRTYLKAVANFPRAPEGLIASTGFVVLRPNGTLHPRFTYWAALSEPFIENVVAHSEGVSYPAISSSVLGSLHLPVPPLEVQERIANFLDEQTARIDLLIAEKYDLLKLLDEYSSSVLGQVFTHGCSSTTPLRKTGIEWLPSIPATWRLTKFMAVSSVVRGASPRPAGDPRFFDGEHIPWVTVAEITKDESIYLKETSSRLTPEGQQYSRRFTAGTLLLSNSGATLGVPKILAIDACANDGVVGFERLSSEVRPVFAYYYLRSLTASLRERIRQGAGQPNLNTTIVKSLPLPLPTLEEQDEVIELVQELDQRSQNLAAHVYKHIERLREYRSSLISAAVTGQLDLADSSALGIERLAA